MMDQAYSPFVASSYEMSESDNFTGCGLTIPCGNRGPDFTDHKHWMFIFKVHKNKWYKPEFATRFPNIHKEREDAVAFFMRLANASIPKIAIENPIGIMSSRWKKPTQIIQPWHFGDPERKGTCLWLKNLPILLPTEIVQPRIIQHASGKTDGALHFETLKLPKEERRKARSVTFQGIAKAMARQWG
jgi:hypothetical protein